MNRDLRIECRVEVPPEQQFGNFANAFRVVPLRDGEWVLDFLALSESRKQASVVARVRVDKTFLESIRDRVDSTLEEIQEQPLCGGLTPQQVEEMWFEIGCLPVEDQPIEGALPLAWFILPTKKAN